MLVLPGPFTGLALLILMALMVAVVGVIVFVEGGQRRIPVQYAKWRLPTAS